MPTPVRPHASHEDASLRMRSTIPGPGEYTGKGINNFDPVSQAPSIPKACRLKQLRQDATPGPVYDLRTKDSRVAPSFSKAARFPQERQAVGVFYNVKMPWDHGVTFSRAGRYQSPVQNVDASYNPEKPKLRCRSAFFSSEQRTQSKSISTCIPLPDPVVISRAMDATRPHVEAPSFATAKRQASVSTADIGPGQYNPIFVEKHTKVPTIHQPFKQHRNSDLAPPLRDIGNPTLLSCCRASPQYSFSRDCSERGIPNPADFSIPSAKYNITTSQGGRAALLLSKHAVRTPEHSDSIGEAYTSLSGPSISFPHAPRSACTTNSIPGPGEYELVRSCRPRTATRFSASRRGWELAAHDVPGPKYSPNYDAIRPPSTQNILINRKEKSRSTVESNTSSPSYTPLYTIVDKNPRAAVVGLTG